jgi:hypothetical protein
MPMAAAINTGGDFLMLFNCKSFFPLRNKNKPSFLDITKYGQEQYQDIIINNIVVKKASGNHETEARYNIIREVLNRYRRPFCMLDIGASQGYFSFRAAHEYDCVCVMIEGNNTEYPKVGTQLLDLCEANDSLENIILLNKEVVPEDLLKLGECESFSVVLALNIIHWFGQRWKEVADAILGLGDKIIIETPPEEKQASQEQNSLRKAIEEYLIFREAKIIGRVPRHTSSKEMANIYLLETEKKRLTRKHWLAPKTNDQYTIASNYETKTITKWPPHAHALTVCDWKPGINLITFLMYNGAYPSRAKIEAAVRDIQDPAHNDWTVNNMILQGNRVSLIDWDDPSHGLSGGRKSTPKVLRAHLHIVGLQNPDKVENYFWDHLVKM